MHCRSYYSTTTKRVVYEVTGGQEMSVTWDVKTELVNAETGLTTMCFVELSLQRILVLGKSCQLNE